MHTPVTSDRPPALPAAAVSSPCPDPGGTGCVPHGARQVQHTTDSACKPACALGQQLAGAERRVGLCAPHDDRPDSVRAVLGQPLRINWQPDEHSPLHGLVPGPRSELTGTDLEQDPLLAKDSKDPDYLEAFNRLLEERRALEARGGEFCFPPLKVTLRNMDRFIDHIRDGQQFYDPLTEAEDRALVWVQQTTAVLLKDGAPYKRTVSLAIAFLTLCEIITDRQVLSPLQATRPALFRAPCLVEKMADWSPELGRVPGGAGAGQFSAKALDPAMVAALCWGGNNPDGAKESELLFSVYSNTARLALALTEALHNPDLLLYPSFQELDIDDFCQFGHLALHPVGMTTGYACKADGCWMSPLVFAKHDLNHMSMQVSVGHPRCRPDSDAEYLWAPCENRLGWRRLLLDQLPVRLGPLELVPALQLLLFQLFHENAPSVSANHFLETGGNPFIWCLKLLAHARRERRNGYSPRYRDVSDQQAAMAALWTVRLWSCWQAAGYRPPSAAALEACARQFLDKDLPRLGQHLDFVQRHRERLRPLLAARACLSDSLSGEGSWRVEVKVDCDKDCVGMRGEFLFRSFHDYSGLRHLDHTDVAYFAALHSPRLWPRLVEAFGPDLPPCDSFLPDRPL